MEKSQRQRITRAVVLGAMLQGQIAVPIASAAEHDAGFRRHTETPIEHVIVLIGENRTFDHVFGTYVPRHGQTISNLLSKGIVNADGTPGPNFGRSAQFTVTPQPAYYIAAPVKAPYAVLPPPTTGGSPTAQRDTAPPFKTLDEAAAAETDLAPADLVLLTSLPARPCLMTPIPAIPRIVSIRCGSNPIAA